ncbi:hypothetical protein Tco_1483078 [Tanacetum coccineum]
MSQPANDEFLQHLSDDEESNHDDASDTGVAPKQQQQVIPQTTTILNIKLPILKKEEYDIWAMEMEHYLEYIDNDVWKKAIFQTTVLKPLQYPSEGSLPPAWSNLAMTMRTKPDVDTLSIDDLYNNLRVFEQEIQGASKTSSSAQNVAFVSQSKSSTNKDLLHEDLEQIDDLDIEEMDINWQIAMIAIRMKKFYKKTGRRVRVDGKTPVGFDKKKLECFNCHNTGHFAREMYSEKDTCCKKRRDSFYQHQEAGKQEKNQMGLLTMDDGIVNWGEHTEDEETNHALMAISSSSEKPIKDQATPKVNRKNWNAMMKANLEAEVKKQRVCNTGNGMAKPVWTNANRVNHANQFVPRPVQLKTGRPNANSVRPNVNTGRVNVNSVRSNVNTGRTNVNPVRPTVNTGSSNVNTVRSRQPVPTKTSNSFSPKRPQDHPLKNMVDRGIFDSGCSGHMTASLNGDEKEVIQRGNGSVSVSTDTNSLIKVLPPKTVEEILARERDRKARTTLLMALPEDHLAKFHKITNAKEMWEAIKSRFGGND